MARDREIVQVPAKTWTEITNADTATPFTWCVVEGEETWFQGMPSAVAPTGGREGIPYQHLEGESLSLTDFWGSSAVRLFAYSELGSNVYANG